MRTLVLAGLTLTVALSSLAAQTDTTKQANPKGCCAGMGAGGMQHGGMHHGGGMMGGMGQMGMGQGGMGGMDGMMGPMGKVMAFDPEHLLAAKDKLTLTEQQVTRLTALRDAGKKAADDAHQPAHAAMQSIQKELESAKPDSTTLRQLFMAHSTGMANVMWAKASTALQARAVLTDAQQDKVEEMRKAMPPGHTMRHGAMPGMKPPAKP